MDFFFIPQKLVLDSPIQPSSAWVRTILASVFNRDIDPDAKLSEAEAIVVLGSKMLLDIGFEKDHVQTIFRRYREDIETWTLKTREAVASHVEARRILLRPGPLMLMISDNRRSSITYGDVRTRYYDFIEGKELTTPTGVGPILQIALSLSQLFESAVDTRRSDWYRQSAKEAVELAKREDRVSD